MSSLGLYMLPICDSERTDLEMSTIIAVKSKGCLHFYNDSSVGVSLRGIHELRASLTLWLGCMLCY